MLPLLKQEANILQAKKEIEEKFELEKWHKIAEAVEAKSGNKYPPTAIQKKFKELSRKMNAGKGAGNTAKNETDCGSLRLGDVRTFAPWVAVQDGRWSFFLSC